MRHDHHAPRYHAARLLLGVSGLLVAAAAGSAIGAPAGDAPREWGIWFNHSGRGAVEIRPCGTTGRDADRLCGFIVWLKDPNNKRGKPLTDGYNTNPSKRKRPICGLPVLGALRPMSDGSWDQGWVYDPEQGKSFDAAIKLRSSDRLILTGYKGIKFFSKSFVWKRAPDDLPRCDGEQEARATISGSGGGSGAQAEIPPLPGRRAAAVQTLPVALTPPRPVPAVRPGTAAAQ